MNTNSCALIDSHCHPHFPPLGDDIAAVLEDMRTHHVAAALAVATCADEVATVKSLAANHPGVFYAACGVHPTTDEDADAKTLAQWCDDDIVLAVGETGLDFFRREVDEERQRRRFSAHIEAARRIGKPLIIHTRDSIDATLEMLEQENAADIGGVLHCFTGDARQMRRALAINFYVSFSGIVSFKNAGDLRDVLKQTPPQYYLVETDSPYLAPTPHRGKTNTPGFVRHVAAAAAQARNCSEEQVAAETTGNFNRLFRPPNADR